MITIKTRPVDDGVYCLQLHYLIEHFIAGKKEEEIDWRLVNTLNNLIKDKMIFQLEAKSMFGGSRLGCK